MELILGIGVGLIVGMYITTQIRKRINKNIDQNQKLLDNMKRYDDTYNKGNFTYYYTHKKKKTK